MLELVQAINRTNSRTVFDAKLSIADAIAERDVVGKKRDQLGGAGGGRVHAAGSLLEIRVKFVATLPIGDLQKQADQLSKRFRELDTRIQELNWKTDLV